MTRPDPPLRLWKGPEPPPTPEPIPAKSPIVRGLLYAAPVLAPWVVFLVYLAWALAGKALS